MKNIKEKSEGYISFKDKVDIICKIIGAFSVLISAIALITTLYPQSILGNDNLLNKANAGHVKSQMLLAEHYFEIGEYEDSVYWYKIASTNDGKYQAAACNNLGLLYANGFGLSDHEFESYYRYERAYQLFRVASDLGLEKGNDNAVNVLRMNDREFFPTLSDFEIASFLEDNYYSEVKSTAYKSFEICKGAIFWEDNTKYTYSGAYTEIDANGRIYKGYKYYGQTYRDDAEITEYKFVYLSELDD